MLLLRNICAKRTVNSQTCSELAWARALAHRALLALLVAAFRSSGVILANPAHLRFLPLRSPEPSQYASDLIFRKGLSTMRTKDRVVWGMLLHATWLWNKAGNLNKAVPLGSLPPEGRQKNRNTGEKQEVFRSRNNSMKQA